MPNPNVGRRARRTRRRGDPAAAPVRIAGAVSELVKAGIPVVAIASGRLSEALSCVRIDDFSAGRK